MKWLRTIFDFYIDSCIHVALSVISLLFVSGIFLSVSIPEQLIFFVFFSTISCYNTLKYGTKPADYLIEGRVYGYAIILLSAISFILAAWYAYFMPARIWIIIGILFILIIFYIRPVLPRDRNLRSLGVVKVLIVSATWTAVTVILPVIAADRLMDWDITVFSIQRFLLIIALIIPFEIRDMKFDPPDIRTIPRRIGVATTKQLGVLLLLSMFALTFLRDDFDSVEVGARLAIILALTIIILKTPVSSSKYYASFWVESVPILWYGFIYLMYSLF